MKKKQLYKIIIAPGTSMEETVYADGFKYNKKDDTYTYHLVIKRKITVKKNG